MFLQQFAHQLESSFFVSLRLHQNIKDFAFGINGPPKVHALAVD